MISSHSAWEGEGDIREAGERELPEEQGRGRYQRSRREGDTRGAGERVIPEEQFSWELVQCLTEESAIQ